MSIQVVLVGCGNMGYAMLSGWLKSGHMVAGETFVVEPDEDLRERAKGLGSQVYGSEADLPADLAPLLVILAVKPQVIRDVTAGYRRFASGDTVFLSIAAGTTIATFADILGDNAAIVRCMPNTPASIGKGMMALYANAHVSQDRLRFVEELLATSGAVVTLDSEDQMDAVTAVSGSGPAYVFHFIECLTAAGEKAGLPAETARLLAMQTVYGAANLAKESPDEPGKLRVQVTSPNGTTAAAMAVFMDGSRMEALVTEAVEAARKRSVELAK